MEGVQGNNDMNWGYKNLDIRWKSESILRAWDDIEYGNIRRGRL